MLLWMSAQYIFWPGKNKARASVNRVQIAFNTTSSTELLPSAPIAYEHAAPGSAQFAYGLPWDPLVIHRVPKMRLCDSIHKTQQIQLRLLTPIGWTAGYRGGGEWDEVRHRCMCAEFDVFSSYWGWKESACRVCPQPLVTVEIGRVHATQHRKHYRKGRIHTLPCQRKCPWPNGAGSGRTSWLSG